MFTTCGRFHNVDLTLWGGGGTGRWGVVQPVFTICALGSLDIYFSAFNSSWVLLRAVPTVATAEIPLSIHMTATGSHL